MDAVGHIAAQAVAEWGELEAPPLELLEDTDRGEGAQQAVERVCMRFRCRSKVVARPRPARKEIGELQRCGDVQGLRHLVPVDEAEQCDVRVAFSCVQKPPIGRVPPKRGRRA